MSAPANQAVGNWLVPLRRSPSADSRIVFFPFAGGGPSAFWSWAAAITGAVELWAVQLPGRERRMREPPHRHLNALLESLLPEIALYVDRPTAFVGHSMGAMIAFEAAHALRAAGVRLPDLLVVSASPAPHWPRVRRRIYTRPDDEVVQELVALNGTQPAILNNREMMALTLPTFRADCELIETYEYRQRDPLPIPVVAAGGVDDASVPLESLRAWSRHTDRSFAVHELEGDHLFILKSPSALQEIVDRRLRALVTRSES